MIRWSRSREERQRISQGPDSLNSGGAAKLARDLHEEDS